MTMETILIIDDSPDIRLLLKSILQKRGYTILTAENGEKGIRLARTERVDLIMLDVVMPGIDGFAVCETLKEDPVTGEIPILFLSAKSDAQDKVKGLRLGGADYITKPFDKGEVLARVQTHLKIRRLSMELAETNASLLERNARMEEDLRAASEIQRSLLPQDSFAVTGELCAAWQFEPSEIVGGDLFNMFPLAGNRLGFYMLDVSGHGVSAALVAVSVAQALQPFSGIVARGEHWEEVVPPNEVLSALDSHFPMERFDKFFTIFYGVLDPAQKTLTYSSAGHPPAFILGRDDEVEFLDKGGTIIGLGGVLPFEGGTVSIEPGDKVVVYTDGIVEYEREDGEMLGQSRLLEILAGYRSRDCDGFVTGVTRDVLAFGQGCPPKDDQSLLAFEISQEAGKP